MNAPEMTLRQRTLLARANARRPEADDRHPGDFMVGAVGIVGVIILAAWQWIAQAYAALAALMGMA